MPLAWIGKNKRKNEIYDQKSWNCILHILIELIPRLIAFILLIYLFIFLCVILFLED